MSTVNPVTRANYLAAIENAAAEAFQWAVDRDRMIADAVTDGVTQVEAAKAAGMSQARVSRVVSARRKREEARQASERRAGRREGGKV